MVEAYSIIGRIINLEQISLIEDGHALIFHCRKPLVTFAFFVMFMMWLLQEKCSSILSLYNYLLWFVTFMQVSDVTQYEY